MDYVLPEWVREELEGTGYSMLSDTDWGLKLRSYTPKLQEEYEKHGVCSADVDLMDTTFLTFVFAIAKHKGYPMLERACGDVLKMLPEVSDAETEALLSTVSAPLVLELQQEDWVVISELQRYLIPKYKEVCAKAGFEYVDGTFEVLYGEDESLVGDISMFLDWLENFFADPTAVRTQADKERFGLVFQTIYPHLWV